ncbi:hypothetical protein ABH920_003731 [Catenulispora sp. EB89]|uniref:hypothetical protein n=1 Tax=Catenulispora sp. EB89 TaxID=3156257 RepID=UPI0035127AC1
MTTNPEGGPGDGAAASPDLVAASLKQEFATGSGNLAAAVGRPGLGGIGPALDQLRLGTGFQLTDVEVPDPEQGLVTLHGNGRFGLPRAALPNTVDVAVLLQYTAPGGRDRFSLRLTVKTPGWTFGTTFPALPPTAIGDDAGRVDDHPSFLSTLELPGAAFTAVAETGRDPGLTLSGTLAAAPVLEPYAAFFGPFPLTVSGPVELPADVTGHPSLDLTALSPHAPLGLGPAALAGIGLLLRCRPAVPPETPDDLPTEAYSQLYGRAEVRLGGSEAASGVAVTPLLNTRRLWIMEADLRDAAPGVPPGPGAIAGLIGLDASDVVAAPGLDAMAGFRIAEFEAGIVPPGQPGGPAIDHAAVTLVSDRPWPTPLPFLSIREAGTRWLAQWVGQDRPGYISGSFFGTADITVGDLRAAAGRGGDPGAPAALERSLAAAGESAQDPDATVLTFSLTAGYPGWGVQGLLLADEIPLDDVLILFFGTTGPVRDLRIVNLLIGGDLDTQTLVAGADIVGRLDIPIGGRLTLALTDVGLTMAAGRGGLTGGIVAGFELAGAGPGGGSDPRFSVGAEYTGAVRAARLGTAEGWVFTGRLDADSTVDLARLLAGLLDREPPAWVPRLLIDELETRFTTGTGAAEFRGAVSGNWTPALFPGLPEISVAAEAELVRAGRGEPLDAELRGTLTIGRLVVEAALALAAGVETYEFSVDFCGLTFSAVSGWRADPDPDRPKRRVIVFQAGGVSLGTVLEYLVSQVAPTSAFHLEAPWDVLNRIELSRFTVTVDPGDDGSVEVAYRADAALPMMRLDTVGIRSRRQDGRPTVELLLTGEFLGTEYRDGKPLAWDVLREPAPTVPGRGSGTLDLRYLGLGQRIALSDPQPDTVRDAVRRLSGAMLPAPADRNPLRTPQGSAMRFAADAEWLLGLEATIAEVLDLAVVFGDPRLYGLAVGLSGERAGALAGLAFEVLYKKVSDDAGVFRIELKVPDAFRRIELGAVAVTLGLIVVEVGTDGSFLVDLGFPHGMDFGRSFSVEVAPFLGRGGLYFGVLDKAAGALVPAVTDGVFSPVIALGVGIAAGVGREVRSGPLSGGAYVELIAVFEGVFAWYTPAGANASTAQYHWVEATVSVHGKVYATVDLAILHVSVTIEAWATASVTLESYRATRVALSASVTVHASLEILFIRLSFEFSAEVDLGFTLGTDQPTPWTLAAAPQGDTFRRRSALPPARRRPERTARLLQARHVAQLAAAQEAGADVPDWDPTTRVFPDSPRTVNLYLLPVFAVDGVQVHWSPTADQAAAGSTPEAAPRHRIAFTLLGSDGGTPTAAGARRTPASAELDAQAPTARDLPAQRFVEAFLRWGLSAVTGHAYGEGRLVTAGQMAALVEDLARPDLASTAFGRTGLPAFFRTNLHLVLSGVPTGTPAPRDGTAVPLPPVLSWTSGQLPPRDFATHNQVGDRYAAQVARRAAQFSPTPPPPDAPLPPDGTPEAFASRLYRDWCLMVARTAAQAAADAMASWQLTLVLDEPSNLDAVARMFPLAVLDHRVRPSETVESAADALGATPDQLLFWNPDLAYDLAETPAGEDLEVRVGVSPETVAADVADHVVPNLLMDLGTVDYPVAETDTLQTVAERFGLGSAGRLFLDPERDLAGDPRLLRAGAEVEVPGGRRPWTGSTLMAAALYFARYAAPADLPGSAWYAERIFALNSALIEGGPAAVIPAGTGLKLPTALHSADTVDYAATAGDTVPLLAACLALAHGFPGGGDGPAGWPAFRTGTTPAPGGVDIPDATVAVLPGESLRRFALRTVVHAADPSGVTAWLGASPVLTPLFVLPVPGARIRTDGGETLAEVARRSGLALPDFARRIAAEPIFRGTVELAIARLPAQEIDRLVEAVADQAAGTVAANSARQLMSGQRLPLPGSTFPTTPDGAPAAEPLAPLYELTGQLVDGPAPDGGDPSRVALDVAVSVNQSPENTWVRLSGSTVADADVVQAFADSGILPADAAAHNPALAADPARLRPGMILLTGPTDALTYQYTNSQLRALYPPFGMTARTPFTVEALPTSERVPTVYGLSRKTALQTPVMLRLPWRPDDRDAPLTGTATLWPFPAPLRRRALAADGAAYDVWSADPTTGQGGAAPLPGTTFGTLIDFTVRRSGTAGGYDLIGADPAGRALALAVHRHLASLPEPDGTVAYVTALPAPDASDTAGRAVLDADARRTYLLRTNQSTRSLPPDGSGPAGAGPAAAEPPAHALLDDVSGFCLVLWLASVTGGTGARLGFATSGGGDLPPGIFDERGLARLGLLVVTGARQVAAPGRTLLPIDTCVVASPRLDPGTPAVYAVARNDVDATVRPVLRPGTAGFRLGFPEPDGAGDVPRMRRLFSLMTAAVTPGAGGTFAMPPSGMPTGPQNKADPGLPLSERARLRRLVRAGDPEGLAALAGTWWFEQALPVTRFGPASPAPQAEGLPAAYLDPYRGIAGTSTPLAKIAVGFADVLGDTAAPGQAGGELVLDAPVGYTDALLGVSAWPAVTLSYALVPPSAPGRDVTLAATLAPQPAALAPGADPAAAAQAALRAAERYAEVYYQLAGGRVSAHLLSALRQVPGSGGEPDALPVDAAPLLRFATAGHLAARAAAALVPATAGGPLRAVLDVFGVDVVRLAEANAGRPFAAVFGAGADRRPEVPAVTAVAAGDSADSLAAAPRPPGWPRPDGGTALLLLPDNATGLPLRPGAVLETPAREVVLPGPDPVSLALAAGIARTEPGLLAEDNADRGDILRAGFVFAFGGLEVEVPEGVFSFADLRAAFADGGATASVAALAEESAEQPGMLRGGVRLASRHYVVGSAAAGDAGRDSAAADAGRNSAAGDADPAAAAAAAAAAAETAETLAANGSGFGAADLAPLNHAAPDLFEQGALVRLGMFGTGRPQPGVAETLAEYAGRFGCPPAVLLAANLVRTPPADAAVAVPGAALVPEGEDAPLVPYPVAPGERLAAIAAKFAATAGRLAAGNAALPVLTAGHRLVVAGAATLTVAGDSFAAVLGRLRAQNPAVTLDQLAGTVAGMAGLLAADAVLICPPAVPVGAPGSLVTPRALAAEYRVDVRALLEANAGTLGVLGADVPLRHPDSGPPVRTAPSDTVNALIWRLAAAGRPADIAGIAASNLDTPCVRAGAALLLPPAPVTLTAPLGARLGSFAEPVFPLTTTLRLSRPGELVDAAFRTPGGDGPVQRADTPVPAPAAASGAGGDGGLTLAAFAEAFHGTFPDLRLGTARTGSAEGGDSGGDAAADLWVVDFRKPEGVASVRIAPLLPLPHRREESPRILALRPLYESPVNRRIEVATLRPDGTLAPATAPTDFQGVDVEVPARRLLADVDLFLGPAYAPAVFDDPAVRAELDGLLAAKRQLAEAVARGLDPVLDLPDSGAARGRRDAIDTLRQELGASLSRAYDTAAVAQYRASVDSPWVENPALPAARLVGPVRHTAASRATGAAGSVPVSIGSGVVPLDQAVSNISLLLRVADPARHASVPVDLVYDVLDLQFGVTPVPAAQGFEDSSWLAFYPPLTGTDKPAALRETVLGASDIPIPLRTYPGQPVLLGHTARPTSTSTHPTLEQSQLWTYAVTYVHEHAEQDEVLINVLYNVEPTVETGISDADDVAAALIGYQAVADDLWTLLGHYAGAPGIDPTAAANAVRTFRSLVAAVSVQWFQRWPAPDADPLAAAAPAARGRARPASAPGAPALIEHDFMVRAEYAAGPDEQAYLSTLTMTWLGDGVPHPATWPAIVCRLADGTEVPLDARTPDGTQAVYEVPEGARVPATPAPELTLSWGALPSQLYQNATVQLSVRRNQRLLGPDGPPTRAPFVFRTAPTEAPAPVAPLLEWPHPIDITNLGPTLGAAVEAALRLIAFPVIVLQGAIVLSYGTPVVPDADPIRDLSWRVPVALLPGTALSTVAADVTGAAAAWFAGNPGLPVLTGRSWAVGLSVPSRIDSGSPQPLLVYGALVYRIL